MNDPAKRILVFVNGYRPVSVSNSLEDNLKDIQKNGIEYPNSTNVLHDFDRHQYWTPWNEINSLFINRINPTEIWYADGHHSVATSNFKSVVNFSAISSVYPTPCKNLKKHTFKRTKKIKMKNIRGVSSNMSGIIINLEVFKMYLPSIKELVETEEFAFLYPQILIVALLNSLKTGFLLPKPTIISRDALPTTVVATSGNPYFYPTERVIQHISFFRCVEKIDQILDLKAKRRLNHFTKANKKFFFGIIHDAVKTMDPKLAKVLMESSFKTYLKSKVKALLKNKF